jgi:hypothetical protein
MVAVTVPHLHDGPLPVGLGGGQGGVGLELGQQGTAIAGTHTGGLGQPGAGDWLTRGEQGGVRLAGALALALAGWLLALGVGRRVSGGARSAVEQAEHGEGAKQPHRSGAGGQVPDQAGGATATWRRVDRATEATSSSHDSRSTAR